MNIILLGPQACGKGTQAKKLSEKTGLKHFSTGDALRAEGKSGSELGKEIKKLIDSGQMVSNEIANELIKKAINEYKEKGIIFDGYPRRIEQADFLLEQTQIDAVIQIVVSDEVGIARISNRFICPKCGKGYNAISLPPQHKGECDVDHTQLTQRRDDTPEKAKNRLANYHLQTEPLIAYYKEKGLSVHKINGEQSIEEVFAEITKALNM